MRPYPDSEADVGHRVRGARAPESRRRLRAPHVSTVSPLAACLGAIRARAERPRSRGLSSCGVPSACRPDVTAARKISPWSSPLERGELLSRRQLREGLEMHEAAVRKRHQRRRHDDRVIAKAKAAAVDTELQGRWDRMGQRCSAYASEISSPPSAPRPSTAPGCILVGAAQTLMPIHTHNSIAWVARCVWPEDLQICQAGGWWVRGNRVIRPGLQLGPHTRQ